MKLFCSALACLILLHSKVDGVETTDNLTIRRNIAYTQVEGSNQRLTSLDVYTVAKGSKRPILVWIHGGGWQIGDKSRVQSKPSAFAAKGFVFASVNYRLVPNVTYEEQASDIATAIAYLHTHANKFGGDPDQIAVMGHSAGAHLAALVTTDERYLKEVGLPLNTIKGVVLLDGAGYDIPKQMKEFAGPRSRRLYSKVFGKDEQMWRNASPVTHIDKAKDIPPFLILHVAERKNSKRQSEGLAAALEHAEISATVLPAEGKTHATINSELGQQGDEPTKAVFRFLDRVFQ